MDLSLGLKAKLIPPLSANLISSRYRWLSLELAEPNLGVPPPIDIDPDGTSDVWVLSSDYIGNRGWASYDPLNFPFNSQERPDLETVGEAVDEVIYVDPRITVFAAIKTDGTIVRNNLLLEPTLSQTWAPATLSWGTTKVNPLAITAYYLNLSGTGVPSAQWITGGTEFTSYLHPGLDGSQPYPGFTSTHNTTYVISLTAEDWRGDKGIGTFNVSYRAPIIFGISTSSTISNSDILNGSIIPGVFHNRAPRASLSNTFPITFAGSPVYYFLAYPRTYNNVSTTTVRRLPITSGGTPVQNLQQQRDLFINGNSVEYFLEVSRQPLNITAGETYTVTYT